MVGEALPVEGFVGEGLRESCLMGVHLMGEPDLLEVALALRREEGIADGGGDGMGDVGSGGGSANVGLAGGEGITSTAA